MENEPNTPGPLESALRVRAPFAPVATLSISEEHPDRLIVAMVQRMPSGGGWCQLLEVRGNTVRFLPNKQGVARAAQNTNEDEQH